MLSYFQRPLKKIRNKRCCYEPLNHALMKSSIERDKILASDVHQIFTHFLQGHSEAFVSHMRFFLKRRKTQ